MTMRMDTPPRPKNMRKNGTCVTLYIPNEILEQLQKIEDRYGSSRSFCATRALTLWLETDGAEMLR